MYLKVNCFVIVVIQTNSMSYGTQKSNSAITRISNNPYPEPKQQFLVLILISLRFILISSHLRLRLTKGFFSLGLACLLKFESTPLFFNSGYMTWSFQSSRFNHPDYIRWTVQTMKLLVVATARVNLNETGTN